MLLYCTCVPRKPSRSASIPRCRRSDFGHQPKFAITSVTNLPQLRWPCNLYLWNKWWKIRKLRRCRMRNAKSSEEPPFASFPTLSNHSLQFNAFYIFCFCATNIILRSYRAITAFWLLRSQYVVFSFATVHPSTGNKSVSQFKGSGRARCQHSHWRSFLTSTTLLPYLHCCSPLDFSFDPGLGFIGLDSFFGSRFANRLQHSGV